MTPDDFFAEVPEWSQQKHRILKAYLQPWVYKLSSWHQTLVFVDTCAGAGRYADGSEGSPLIAARYNDTYLRDRGKRLFVLAFEEDPDVFRELERNLAPWNQRTPPEARAFEQPFTERLDEVVRVTRGFPTLFFVDPYGLQGITTDDLAPLLDEAQRPRTEVLLRIDPGLIARAVGQLHAIEREDVSERQRRAAESFERTLRRCNMPEDLIRIARTSPDELRGEIKRLALHWYRSIFSGFEFVQLVEIRASYDAAPKYFLLHATNSPHGAAKMNDVVSTAEDALFERAESLGAAGQLSFLGPAPRPLRSTLAECKDAVVALLEEAGPLEMIQVAARLALWFGPDFREKDHRRAMRELRSEGRLTHEGQLRSSTVLRRR